jgi:hypothetical protein
MINAYICEIDPTLTNERSVDHAKKMVHYLPLIQEKISSMPMQMTIYLEFCAKALAEETGRLRSMGWHQGRSQFSSFLKMKARLNHLHAAAAYSLEKLAELTMVTMAKVARAYNLQ